MHICLWACVYIYTQLYTHRYAHSLTHTHTHTHIYIYIYIYIYISSLYSRRMKHKIIFAAINRFEIKVFSSTRLVANPRLKSPACPTIFP